MLLYLTHFIPPLPIILIAFYDTHHNVLWSASSGAAYGGNSLKSDFGGHSVRLFLPPSLPSLLPPLPPLSPPFPNFPCKKEIERRQQMGLQEKKISTYTNKHTSLSPSFHSPRRTTTTTTLTSSGPVDLGSASSSLASKMATTATTSTWQRTGIMAVARNVETSLALPLCMATLCGHPRVPSPSVARPWLPTRPLGATLAPLPPPTLQTVWCSALQSL